MQQQWSPGLAAGQQARKKAMYRGTDNSVMTAHDSPGALNQRLSVKRRACMTLSVNSTVK
jgi:hypothetical protein